MLKLRSALPALPLLGLSACAAVGSVMSPYSEKFSCKNSDHGQCIHPDQAYADALAGRGSKSDAAVTNDRKLLGQATGSANEDRKGRQPKPSAAPQFGDAKIGTLVETSSSPMLKPSQTVRTLILPYADKQRPDRLYMARYVYSIVDRPAWVVGDYLVEPGGRVPAPPVLRTMRDNDGPDADAVADTDVSRPGSHELEHRP